MSCFLNGILVFFCACTGAAKITGHFKPKCLFLVEIIWTRRKYSTTAHSKERDNQCLINSLLINCIDRNNLFDKILSEFCQLVLDLDKISILNERLIFFK